MTSRADVSLLDLQVLVSAMPDAYIVIDPAQMIVAASDAYLNIFGLTRDDLIGVQFAQLLPLYYTQDPELTDDICASLLQAFQLEKADTSYVPQVFQPKPVHANTPSDEWHEISHHPIVDAQGHVSHVIHRLQTVKNPKHVFNNTAEKERLEAEIFMHAQKVAEANKHLHNSRAFLKNIIDSVPDPIFVKDAQHRIIEGNAAMWTLFGRSEEDIIGKTDYDFFPKAEADVFLEKDNEVFASSIPNINIENFTDAGGVTHIISTKKACFNTADGQKILVGVIRDITEITQIQAKLRETDEARLKSIMDHSGRHVYIKDLEGRYLQMNSSLLEMIGQQEKDVLGKTDYDFFPAAYAEEFRKNDALVLSQGAAIEFEEIAPENGEDHFYTSVKFPLYDTSGTIYAICGISADITERKRGEQQLQMTMEQLTESNVELERFAYICSHDLQEPLRMISNYTQRLVKHIDKHMDDKGRRYVQYILDGAANARDLIDDVLIYARIGNEFDKVDAVDCNAALAMVLKQLMLATRNGGAHITFGTMPTVHAHKTRVAQLLQNLISNAIKFRHSERAPEIHISAERKGDFWQFAVTDNGIGIPDDYKEKVFIIFQRLNKRSEYPGTGIGLALCKKIVESYQGKIWLESHVNRGTTFYFTLPAAN